MEDARKSVESYLNQCGRKWFQARHTSLTAVTKNEPLMARLASEVERSITITGVGYASAAKMVCDEDLTTYPEFK